MPFADAEAKYDVTAVNDGGSDDGDDAQPKR
jgi:hypothetical protein